MTYSVLEVGGTHVTAALVDAEHRRVLSARRTDIDSSADADTLIDTFVTAVRDLEKPTQRLAVAIPGPFDYATGVGDFEGVEKLGALRGVGVGDELSSRIGMQVCFLNDVTAYGIGQHARLGEPSRLVVLTLGTGVGSVFLQDGVPVTDGPRVPDNGWVYTLHHEGRPIEDTFSRRAIIAAYTEATGLRRDVVEVASLAQRGDPGAVSVLEPAYTALAETVSPWILRFEADTVVLGGSIAKSWELIERWFEPVIEDHVRRAGMNPLRIVPGVSGEEPALIGAALYAARQA